MLHAILVDKVIERIKGSSNFVDAEVEGRRAAGRVAEYLFAARSEEQFERKKQHEIESAMPVYPVIKEWRHEQGSHCEQYSCWEPRA